MRDVTVAFPRVPMREQLRLGALHRYEVLDAPADDELDAVMRVASIVAGVPYATLNLIDENRQCQLTTVGFEGGDSPRSHSMCAIQFETGHTVHLPDARDDPRYADNPWVTGALAKVRSYTSVPLITDDGFALGTLCVFDLEPGELTAEQLDRLADCAAIILALFERRRQARVNAGLAAEAAAQRGAVEQAHTALAERGRQLVATVADLQRSNAELAQFAGAVSHDLLAPLGVVGGYLELLDEMHGDALPDRARTWIGTAAAAVTRMKHLIRALLGYAQAGNGPVRLTPTDLREVLDQTLADLRDQLDDAEVRAEPDLPTVDCDPTLLRQLLQNLIGNAVKYRDPRRPCRITVTATATAAGSGRPGVTVALADNGIGIPAEHRRRVFEAFAQLDPGCGGHGIGLSTCARIVDRHDGRIWADETPGGGTTIRFTLPLTAGGPGGPPHVA